MKNKKTPEQKRRSRHKRIIKGLVVQGKEMYWNRSKSEIACEFMSDDYPSEKEYVIAYVLINYHGTETQEETIRMIKGIYYKIEKQYWRKQSRW